MKKIDDFNLLSVREMARRHPCFSEASLRWLIAKSSQNGLYSAIVRVGRRILINVELFEAWIKAGAPDSKTKKSETDR